MNEKSDGARLPSGASWAEWGRELGRLSGLAHLQDSLGAVRLWHEDVFSLPGLARGCAAKLGSGFLGGQRGAAGGRLQLTCDDLVRCERALSNLERNKLQVIFYETSVPGLSQDFSLPHRCALSV